MPLTEEEKRKMRENAEKAKIMTHNELSESLKIILSETTPNMEALKQIVTDPEKYDRMIAAVEEASAKNENLAQLRDRLVKIGLKGAEILEVIVKIKGF
ncbi:MAG: hypothetical protein P9X24_01710 [Candidatus Hatepunaea meridiana]|nr:hypothetical protein [Candidatus Hatepunaea meridiana]